MAQRKIIATVINDVITDQRMQRICTTLANNNYKICLIGRKISNKKTPDFNFETQRWKFIFKKGVLFYIEYNFRMFIFLLIAKYDIVHTVDADTLVGNVLAAKIKRKKIVYDAHEWFSEVPELQGRNSKKKIWKWVEKTFIPKTDLRITVNDSLANMFEQLYNVPFYTIRNVPSAISTNNKVSMSPPIPESYILYQGAINEGRGIELLCEAAKEWDLFVVIAGGGPLLNSLSKCYENEQNITFLGEMSPKNLEKWTQFAFLGYNLLENKGLSYVHSLSNKFFDYMKFGVPSINSLFPEYQKITEEYKCGFCIPYEKEELVKIVKFVLNNNEYYEKMKKNSQLAHDYFNWNNEGEKLVKIYK